MQQPEEPPVFPYDIIWDEVGDTWVKLGEHTIGIETFPALRDIVRMIAPDLPVVDPPALHGIVEPLALPHDAAERLVEDASWVAAWYLGPIYRARLRLDVVTARALLKRAAVAARVLNDTLERLSPALMGAMELVRAVEPNVFEPRGRHMWDIAREAHDVALTAERMVKHTAPKRAGPRTKYVRDTALRLIIESAHRADAGPLRISRGSRTNPDRHFEGAAGMFVRAFFRLIAPGTSEAELAQAAERVRRQSGR